MGVGGPTWLFRHPPARPPASPAPGTPGRGVSAGSPLHHPHPARSGQAGTAAVRPHPRVCLSTLFRHHAKGQPSGPNTHFRSPRGRVCVSVTVVQNKFYLSLLYPELDLASYDPLPPPQIKPRQILVVLWSRPRSLFTPPSHPNLSTPPSPPNQSSWVCRHLQGQVMSSLTTSFPPIALPFSHFVPSPQQGEHGFEVSSVQFSRSVVSASLRPRGRQHTRPPCPSPAPEACSNSCPPIGVLPLAGGAEKLRSFSEPVSTSVTQEW